MHRQYDTLLVERDDNFIIIAFYTKDTPYEDEVEEFVACCEKLNLNYYILGYESRGTWERNAAIKPEFILDCMGIWRGRKLVYVDIDARIRKYPDIFKKISEDVGVYYRGDELLSGTLYFSGTAECREIVHAWVREQKQHPDEWDQKVFQRILKGGVFTLPSSYTHIFDKFKGEPVIEHMQASRRYKHKLGGEMIPGVINNIRVQRGVDGSYWIARKNREAEKYLNEHCVRLKNELKWFPKLEILEDWTKLKKVFKGKVLNIIGKGPSLDNLELEDFVSNPTIAINESIFTCEQLTPNKKDLWAIQQDNTLENKCWPLYSGIFVSKNAYKWYAGHPECYQFDGQQLGLAQNGLSVSAAIEIGKRLGVTGFRFLCFDACINGDLRYAESISYSPERGGKPERFLTHRSKILSRCIGYDVEWVTPRTRVDIADDIPQPLPDSLVEHHEPDHKEPLIPWQATLGESSKTEPSPPETQLDRLESWPRS